MEQPRLDITKKFADIQRMYSENKKQQSFNAMIIGNFGTGKTTLLKTCRQPVLLHSFDPGGSKSIRSMIRSDANPKGTILVDTRFEEEDPRNPSACKLWDTEFDALKKADVFSEIGTYCIDSATTWVMAIMNYVLKQASRSGQTPQLQDYGIVFSIMRDAVKAACDLPCDFILTGHISLEKDETTGKMATAIALYPSLQKLLPSLFDEIYTAVSKTTAKGVEYELLTRNTGFYIARSRLNENNILDTYEKPDIKAILKKAGLPNEDKPIA